MKCSYFYTITLHTKKFFIKDFFHKCDQMRRKLRIWSHLLKKYLMENFIFCTVLWLPYTLPVALLLINFDFAFLMLVFIEIDFTVEKHYFIRRFIVLLNTFTWSALKDHLYLIKLQHSLKYSCSIHFQMCLSVYDLLADTRC